MQDEEKIEKINRTKYVGMCYALFSLTFILLIIKTFTGLSAFSDIGLFLGFIGMVVAFLCRKDLSYTIRKSLVNGMGAYVLIELMTAILVVAYLFSALSFLVSKYPSGNFPNGSLTPIMSGTLLILLVITQFLVIPYYILNRNFFVPKKPILLPIAILVGMILEDLGSVYEYFAVVAKVNSATGVSSFQAVVNQLESTSLNIYTEISCIGFLIFALIFLSAAKNLIKKPEEYYHNSTFEPEITQQLNN